MSWDVHLHGRLGRLTIDIDVRCEASRMVLIGPNGAGKTTMLRAIAGAPLPVHGRIVLGDRVLADEAQGLWLPPEARCIGYVPQSAALFPHLTVRDNVTFGLSHGAARERARRGERATPGDDALVARLLEELELDALVDRRPAALSGGERQRVALARALACRPHGLLLDEPLAAMDAERRRRLRRWLADYVRETDLPTIMITHDVRDVVAFGEHVVVIEDGRVAQTGDAHSVAHDPATALVAELFEVMPALANADSAP